MKMFFLIIIFVASITSVYAIRQSPKHLYYYESKSNLYIADATIAINGEVLDSMAYGAYIIPDGTCVYGEKVSLAISHPDYQDFFLEVVVLVDNYIHAIRPQQLYYLSNGVPQPIFDIQTGKSAKKGYRDITVMFSHENYKTKDLAKKAWEELVVKYGLEKGYSYQEAIEKDNHDLMWGCRQYDLNYTFGLKKKNGKKWKRSDALLYQKIRKEIGVNFIGIALNRSKILTNRIEIYYGTQEEVTNTEIEKIEHKFGLKKIPYVYDSTRYYYIQTPKELVTNNRLLQRLMKHPKVKQARTVCLGYDECG